MQLKPMTQATMEYLRGLYPTATREDILEIFWRTPELVRKLVDPKFVDEIPDLYGIAMLHIHAVLTPNRKAGQAAQYCLYELIGQYSFPHDRKKFKITA